MKKVYTYYHIKVILKCNKYMVYNVVYISQYITGHCLIPIIACHMEHNVTIFDIRKLCLIKMMYIVYEVCSNQICIIL